MKSKFPRLSKKQKNKKRRKNDQTGIQATHQGQWPKNGMRQDASIQQILDSYLK